MNKQAALHTFLSSFGLTAYQEDTIPTAGFKPAYPYMTYEVVDASWDEPQPITVNLWYRSTSWVDANAKAREISADIGRGGRIVPCDNGAIWIMRGEPFARSMGDDNDDMIRRKALNLTVEYLTED